MNLNIEENVDLQPFNALAVPACARFYCLIESIDAIRQALEFVRNRRVQLLVLGGGSNIVLRDDFDGLVMHMALRGISMQPVDVGEVSSTDVYVTAYAGESWQALVDFSLEQALWGLENLNLIPGTVGAAPIQNIGAYGVELEQVFDGLSAIRVSDGELVSFTKAACEFSYRDSFFKRAKGEFIIVSVRLRLAEKGLAKLTYPGLGHSVDVDASKPSGSDQFTPRAVALKVAALRRAKLPDPALIPNAGSFFHNPIVSANLVRQLRTAFPEIVAYEQADGRYKLAAAWLIDQAGLKGQVIGGVGVHAHQALVLINPGKCTGVKVLDFAAHIANEVEAKFGVRLVIEPQIYP